MTNALTALAEPIRREIVEQLARQPMAVGELAAGFRVSRPAVSQHLKVLKEAKLVRDRAQGTRRIYYIDPAGFGQIRGWLDRFWDESLAAYADAVERDEEKKHEC